MNRLERFQLDILDDVEVIQFDDSLRTVALRQFASFVEAIEVGEVYQALFALNTALLSTVSGKSSNAMGRIESRLKDAFAIPYVVAESVTGMAHLSILLTVHPTIRMESYLSRDKLYMTIESDPRVFAMNASITGGESTMLVNFIDVEQKPVALAHLVNLNEDAREFSRSQLYTNVGDAILLALWGEADIPGDLSHIVKRIEA